MMGTHDNLDDLLASTIERFWSKQPDQQTETEALSFDNLLTADSASYSLDIGHHLSLQESRWTKLVRDYLDASAVHKFLRMAKAIGTGQTKAGAVCHLPTRQVRSSTGSHRFGNCILGFSYRGTRDEPVISMHSRMAYVSYMGALDLGIVNALARELSPRIETPASRFKFVWHADCLSFHVYKSLPLIWNFRPTLLQDPSTKPNRLQELVRRNFGTLQKNYNAGRTSSFGPMRRVEAAYRRYKENNPRPSCPINKLTLDCLCRV